MKRLLFILVQIVWGFPQTLAGFVIYVLQGNTPRVPFHGATVLRWNGKGSLSLGPFIFISNGANPAVLGNLVVHEYGHCIQSLIFGPLYLIVIGLPSLLWGELPALHAMRKKRNLPYFGFYTERFANYLGTKVTGLAAMQNR